MGASSVDHQLEGEQSANQSVIVMSFLTQYGDCLTMPLKDATSPV